MSSFSYSIAWPKKISANNATRDDQQNNVGAKAIDDEHQGVCRCIVEQRSTLLVENSEMEIV